MNRPVVGLGTGADFSLLASACRGHLVGVCLHGVSVHTVALAVVVVVRRLFIFSYRSVLVEVIPKHVAIE